MTRIGPRFAIAAVLIGLGWTGGQAQPGASAKALFYGHNPLGWVGIQYWLQTNDGTRLTERTAAAVEGTFTLHIQSNTPGYLALWTTDDGTMLTPRYEGYAGHRLDGHTEYVVPGRFRLSASAADGRVVILFARSQTEMTSGAAAAIEKLDRLRAMVGSDGFPSVAVESDETTVGRIGTYVVNRDGRQPGTVVALSRVD
jgi:hypothetical protein